MRWIVTFLLAIAVFMGQTTPAAAGHGSSWIEICGEGGSFFVEVGDDGQKQMPECAHCDFCLTSVGDTQGAYAPTSSDSVPAGFTIISYSIDPAALPDNPEQYWSACRGPPIVSAEKNMTPTISLSIKEPIGSAFKAGVIPCI